MQNTAHQRTRQIDFSSAASISGLIFLVLCLFGFAACGSGVQSPYKTLSAERMAALSEGRFATVVTERGIDYIEVRKPIDPLGEGEWLYSQINNGPKRALYRQSVFQFIDTPDGVTQIEFTFADKDAFEDVLDEQTLRAFTRDDLIPALGPGCAMAWRIQEGKQDFTWRGSIDHKTCQVFSPGRQTKVGLGAEVWLGDGLFRKRDSGYGEMTVRSCGAARIVSLSIWCARMLNQ